MSQRARVPFLSVILTLLCAQLCCGQMQFPDTPQAGQLIQDYAGVISSADKEVIRKIQYQAYEQFDTPIAVVTISSLAEFKASRNQIEKAAHDLFNKWQIGKRDANGNLVNQGILLLVSVGDRRARIELGDDWKRDWDDNCDQIMKHSIVKQFKANDYSGGILAGVEKLAVMGKAGPGGALGYTFSNNLDLPVNGFSPVPKLLAYILCGVGVLLLMLAFALPQYRLTLIVAGIGLIGTAIFLYVACFALLFLLKLSRQTNGTRSYSGGGGFSSGGFSGGGGATGSW